MAGRLSASPCSLRCRSSARRCPALGLICLPACRSPCPPCLADLDVDGDGFISSEEMVAMLRNKLPKAEVGGLRVVLEMVCVCL